MNLLTVGEISRRCGVCEWAARRVIDNHFSNAVARIGRYRTVPAELLPAIEQKLREGGHGNTAAARVSA